MRDIGDLRDSQHGYESTRATDGKMDMPREGK